MPQGVHAVTDEGVRHVAGCARLKSLDLSHCWKISDSGVSHLPALALLAHLDLAYCWQAGPLAGLPPSPAPACAGSPGLRPIWLWQPRACRAASARG